MSRYNPTHTTILISVSGLDQFRKDRFEIADRTKGKFPSVGDVKLTVEFYLDSSNTEHRSCQVQKHGAVDLLTTRTPLWGLLQQEKGDHKVLQNWQWSTSTPKQFGLKRYRTEIVEKCNSRSSEQISTERGKDWPVFWKVCQCPADKA
jgi:hypothetical protein